MYQRSIFFLEKPCRVKESVGVPAVSQVGVDLPPSPTDCIGAGIWTPETNNDDADSQLKFMGSNVVDEIR